ncbi:cytochrome c oxidase cbb3-type subunit III [Methylophilaceae bacterium]|nr:cytochrome c oxidase cbb3-type subunit III [Methylophilaceae bacterium]
MNAKLRVLIALVFAIFVSQAGAQDLGVKKGKALYEQYCIGCHQAGAVGKVGFAPSLSNNEFLSIVSADFLADTIKNGVEGTGMGPQGALGDEKIRAIVSYLQSLSPVSGSRAEEVAKQPAARGDAKKGAVMFQEVCSTCHGPHGIGFDAGGSGPAVGTPGFLKHATDGYIRTTIKEGRGNTMMKGFVGPEGMANLTSQEIEDIVTYLRTAPAK